MNMKRNKWRMILDIARTELQTLFYSPIAWLTLIIFVVQASMTFSSVFGTYVERFNLGYRPVNLTQGIFSGFRGLYTSILPYLFYYFPLLTMGLMSRELSSGSVKLLYSSPVNNIQIILGKFVSMMIYALVFVGILLVFIIFGACTIDHFDFWLTVSGLLGVYLLICSYAAIGLFMSSLTSYQIVAALGTLSILFVLNMVGGLWQDIEWVRDITWWLSISGRANEFISGLICSEDVLYFVFVTGLFLTLSVLRLNAIRQKISWRKAWSRYLLAFLVTFSLGYITSRPKLMFFCDATRLKVNTLTPNSQEIIKKLKGGLTITTYVNILDDLFYLGQPSSVNSDFQNFKKYWRFKPEIKMKYVYYYDRGYSPSLDRLFPNLSDRERMLELAPRYNMDSTDFKTPEEMKQIIDLSGEYNRFVRVVERESGEKTFLRVFNDPLLMPFESEISVALKRLVMDMPWVGFLTGHGERDMDQIGERGYNLFAKNKLFRHSLPNQGFDVTGVTLEQDIPDSINIIVIADMHTALSENEMRHLQNYIARGGNLFIAGEPTRQEAMNPIVEQFGVQFMPGRLVRKSEHYDPDMIFSLPRPAAWKLAYPFGYLFRRFIPMPTCVGLDYSLAEEKGFEVTTLFTSDTLHTWNEVETVDFIDDPVELNPEVGEKEDIYATGIALAREMNGKEQRIIILGDADCISNAEHNIKRKGIPAYNYAVITGSFCWLSDGVAPFDVRRPKAVDNKVSVTMEGMTVVKILFLWVFPFLLLGIGIFIWIRRKGR